MGYFILALMAAAGLVASAVCHVMGWMQIEPPWGQSVFLLHVGIFVVWIPLIITVNRVMPKGGSNSLNDLFMELSKWVRAVMGGLFLYTIVNFVYFIYCSSKYPKHGVPFPIELRGFSGHWMLFYSIATAGFIALGRRANRLKVDETRV